MIRLEFDTKEEFDHFITSQVDLFQGHRPGVADLFLVDTHQAPEQVSTPPGRSCRNDSDTEFSDEHSEGSECQ